MEQEEHSTQEQGTTTPSNRWQLADHVPLLATIAASAFVVARVLGIAGFEQTTAQAIVHSVGFLDVMLGVAISSLGVLLVAASMIACGWIVFLARRGERSTVALDFGAVVALVLTLFYATDLGVFAFVMVGMAFLISRTIGAGPEKPVQGIQQWGRRFGWALIFIGTTGIGLLLLAWLMVDAVPWLPAEVVVAEDSDGRSDVMLGYVLDTSDGWTSVLTYETGTGLVERVRSDAVKSRTVCARPESEYWDVAPEPLLVYLFGGIRSVPACTDVWGSAQA